ncbi:MAG: hypothetical protein Q9187_001041 [Circinaria calcarea]
METLSVFAAYALSLLTSIVIYRKGFHRLRKFPGPFMAGVTKLWHTANTLDSQNHILLDGLHEKYGDFVRTGPTEITIFTPEVKWAVDGPANHCNKAVWYDILLPLIALNTTRDKKEHDHRRRIWDRAFTVKALEGYEKRIQTYGLLLEKHIASTSGKPVDVSTWFYFLSFDVMGDFAFAKSFKMLESKEWHYAVLMLRRALNLLGPLSSVPWLVQLAFSFPVIPVVRDWNKMISWCAERMALEPQHAKKIRTELDTIPSIYDTKALKTLDHLNGAINETLRLHPSVPTGGYRESPPQGVEIAGHFIPGNTTIVSPRYTMGRRLTSPAVEKSFEKAAEFIPERWYSKPEMVADRKAFTPFSIGRFACVGKNLALAEVRFVTALLVSKYDITFAPGEDGIRVWKDMKDQFTAAPGKLELIFTPLENEST